MTTANGSLILRIRMEHHIVADRVTFFASADAKAPRRLEDELRRIVAEELAKERAACAEIAEKWSIAASFSTEGKLVSEGIAKQIRERDS